MSRADITGTASHDDMEFVIYGRMDRVTNEYRWDIVAVQLGDGIARTSSFVTSTQGYKNLAGNALYLGILAELTRLGVSQAVEYTEGT
jgi:hypothetical protein